jgi:hypothetical protein
MGPGGEVPAAQALQRLARSPPWGWGAMAPVCERILVGAVGEWPLAMAQRLGPPITRGRVPAWAPLLLPEGWRESRPARVPPDGQWVHPERRPAKGPRPRPRWLPGPGRLLAQVGKASWRRRLVGVPLNFAGATRLQTDRRR